MLRQAQGSGEISERFEVLFRPAILNLAYLRLRETKPSSEQFLIERLTIKMQMAGMIPVCLENLADVLTREGCPKFVRLEKLVLELGRWPAELIALFPMTPAAQQCGVVSRKHRSAARTAPRCTSLRIGRTHLIPPG